MYETIKELHIEIDQRIQQITSNRFNNIPPQFYDMMLNRTAIKYIQSKSNRKTNYKAEGLEDSKKRVEDFQSLKRETEWLPVIKDSDDSERGFVLLPSNYLKFITSTSKLQFEKGITKTIKKNTDTNFKNVFYLTYAIPTTSENGIKLKITVDTVTKELAWDKATKFDNDVELPKYLVEWAYETLNDPSNKFDAHFDVYWEYFNNRYYANKLIIVCNKLFKETIEVVIGGITTETSIPALNYTNECFVANTKNTAESGQTPYIVIDPKQIYSENDLIASENIRETLNDFYGNKNRHNNPITELINDRLYVYQGQDFCVSEMKITYLKKPRLFSSDLDQMSDMLVTPEFIDMVVSDILLILKDNTFNLVKQQSNIE